MGLTEPVSGPSRRRVCRSPRLRPTASMRRPASVDGRRSGCFADRSLPLRQMTSARATATIDNGRCCPSSWSVTAKSSISGERNRRRTMSRGCGHGLYAGGSARHSHAPQTFRSEVLEQHDLNGTQSARRHKLTAWCGGTSSARAGRLIACPGGLRHLREGLGRPNLGSAHAPLRCCITCACRSATLWPNGMRWRSRAKFHSS
jgi:hypothetical protein